jgi:AcrR family transcriptional regulator
MPIEVRREQVLDAALRLICQHGYAAANMEAIAREVGVAKTVVYETYGTRERLLRALLEREEMELLASLEVPPSAGLLEWVDHGLRAVRANPAEWRLLLAPAEGTPALVREYLESGRAVVLEHLRGLLAPLRPPDLELAAISLLAVAERAAVDVLDGRDPARWVEFARRMLGGAA